MDTVNAPFAGHARPGKNSTVSTIPQENFPNLVDAFFGAVLIRADNLAAGMRMLAEDKENETLEQTGLSMSNWGETEEVPHILEGKVHFVNHRAMVGDKRHWATGLL